MSDKSNTSFIPKSPVRGSSNPRPVKRLYVISIVTSILFISTVFAAGGIFIYSLSLERNLQAEQQRLNEAREAFNQSDLEQVLEFEARLQAANELLNQQVYLPVLFTALEDTALLSTTYTNFEYESDGFNTLRITLETTNPTFDGAIFQREVLTANPVLQGATISDVSLNKAAENDNSTAKPKIAFTIEHTAQNRLLQRNQPETTDTATTAADTTSSSLNETTATIPSSSNASSSNENNQ